MTVNGGEITVQELFALERDSVLKLDSFGDDVVEVLLEGKVIARGQLIVVDDHLGVSITEMLDQPGA